MVIYRIVNLVNLKQYIGRSSRHTRRWSRHRSLLRDGTHINRHLQRAWNKHGKDVFRFEVIETCQSLEQTYERERYWIAHHRTTDPRYGYNIGSGGKGSSPSPEGILRIVAAHKGKPLSAEHRRKIGAAHRGKTISQKARDQTAESLRKRYAEGTLVAVVPPPKPGALHPMWGKTHTQEVRNRLSTSSRRTYEERMGHEEAARLCAEKREASRGAGNPFYKPFDIEYVRNQIGQGVLAADLIQELDISPPTLYKRFKDTYGLTITQYKASLNRGN